MASELLAALESIEKIFKGGGRRCIIEYCVEGKIER